ncbi:MAG: exodeoxyribonuclease VII large subunit [Clostridia bacterium]|nr:exodeoxyribonuclease VII large subunit [Clostridia bacterium]
MYPSDFSDAEFSFPRALSVSEINNFIKLVFDGIPQFGDLYVNGEISNFKNHYGTGHFYFTLKDESSSIKAVMFKSYASRVKFQPENGMNVTVHGRISVFPRDGQYQIYCDSMEPLGVGALYAAFEQLKAKLSSEGLFDAAHKKQIPKYPGKIGVVTSAVGAAVRDIINVVHRRWPIGKIILFPALVQGDGAAESVISGINYFNENNAADVIIIGRGGGSIEDLWAFNDEKLARTIFSSNIPVISAVGHETDFTISDFVSDVRAPTPSAAAEIAVPDVTELKGVLASYLVRQYSSINSKLSSSAEALKRFKSSRVLTDPMAYIEDRTIVLGNLADRLFSSFSRLVSDKRNKLSAIGGLLNSLSPLSVLSRGYGAVRDDNGSIIKSVEQVNCGENINVFLSDGFVSAEVNSINRGKNNGC